MLLSCLPMESRRARGPSGSQAGGRTFMQVCQTEKNYMAYALICLDIKDREGAMECDTWILIVPTIYQLVECFWTNTRLSFYLFHIFKPSKSNLKWKQGEWQKCDHSQKRSRSILSVGHMLCVQPGREMQPSCLPSAVRRMMETPSRLLSGGRVVGVGGGSGSGHFLVALCLEVGSRQGRGWRGGLSLVCCRGYVSELQVDRGLTKWSEHGLALHSQLEKPERRQLQLPLAPS